jgi:ribonuclease-3
MIIKQEKSSSQKKRLETLFADGCEALIGALYLDGGLEAARSVIHFLWKDHFKSSQELSRDPKSILQEWAQGQGKQHPFYTVISASGPAHAPHFIVEVNVKGFEPAQGEGASKRVAEKEAAQHFLEIVSAHE